MPDCPHPTFDTRGGTPYAEVHHLQPLAGGGPDTPGSVACLCPAHHREAHHGADAKRLGATLHRVRSRR